MSGAEIYHGPWPEFHYCNKANDGQIFELESLSIVSIHTPGHTPGCMSYAVIDKETGKDPVLVFTGDALFVNEVGRTDLGGKDKRREWSANLYDSINNKLLPLGDNVIIYPAHGAGSVCGSHLAEREVSTLGTERLMNPLLQITRKKFLKYKEEEIHELPPYFKMMEKLNKEGLPTLKYKPNLDPILTSDFKEEIDKGAIIIDTRSPTGFATGHIENSYNLYAPTLGKIGWVLSYEKPILLVLDEALDVENITKELARLGYANQVGYLLGSIIQWYKEGFELAKLDTITTYELKKLLETDEKLHVLDVRAVDEYEAGHIEGSQNIYVGLIEKKHNKIPRDVPVAVMCSSGVRSSFAASMLLRLGFNNLHLVLGGSIAWSKANFSLI